MARLDSPAHGNRHLSDARTLVHDMPYTLAALESGVLTESRARLIVREAACLSPADRRRLDLQLCADHSTLIGLGDNRLMGDAKTIAYQLDPQAVIDRATRAPEDRAVTFRPAADNMAIVTALLPASDAACVRSSLTSAADRCADGRNRGQAMADTLVSRVTGRDVHQAGPCRGQPPVLSDDTLFAGSAQPAYLQGHGPIPAATARRMIRDAALSRKLLGHPATPLRRARHRRTRCDGIPFTAIPERPRPVHRYPGSDLPHAVLRCPDPAYRPREAVSPERTDFHGQRSGAVRALQLRQREPRLAGGGRCRRIGPSHHRIHHADRRHPLSVDRATVGRRPPGVHPRDPRRDQRARRLEQADHEQDHRDEREDALGDRCPRLVG